MNEITKPTRKQAIETQCWECNGHYDDGKIDCENVRCPLYAYMPYAKLVPDYRKFAFNPRFVGFKTHEETSRPMSDEQRKETATRLATYREKK